jgi:hypothetical protein
MNNNKAQSAMEFIVIMAGMMAIFVILISVIQLRIGDKGMERKDVAIYEMASNLQDEINLAAASSDGYSRQFRMPNSILQNNYHIEVIGDLIYINTTDGHHSLAIPTYNVTGQPVVTGLNNISKRDGMIYLNS